MDRWMCDLSLWRFPASLILGAAFALWVWALHAYCRKSSVYRLLAGGTTAVSLLVLTAASVAVEGVWAFGLYRTYPFIVLMLFMLTNLGFTTLNRLPQRNAAFLLNHAGLFILLWGALFGAPDTIEARMIVRQGETEHLACCHSGNLIPLPFGVRLDRFTIEYYPDGTTPRQFRSQLTVDGKPLTTEVNAPAHYGGYTIYQDSYDRLNETYTVLLFSRDPWLWVVWLGAAMLAAGSILLILCKR